MAQPAAKQSDHVTASDLHMIQPPTTSGPSLVPHPFTGIINGKLSSDVKIMGLAAATVGSTATNTPPHIPIGGTFVTPPTNKGTISVGSATVMINGQGAARNGDTAITCNDAPPPSPGKVVAAGTVLIGG